MSADNKSRTQLLDKFSLDFLPRHTPQEEDNLFRAVIEAMRAHIVRGVRERGDLDPEDEDDPPPT